MVATVDVNHDGIIDICEFIRMMSLQQNPTLTPEVVHGGGAGWAEVVQGVGGGGGRGGMGGMTS